MSGEKEAQKIEKKTKLREKLANATNSDKQRFTTYLAYVGIIGISLFSSFLSVVFGLDHFDSSRFITNLCFNIAIAIMGLILAWKDGELSNETRKRGPLFDARQLFKKIVLLIIDTESFRQWNDVLFERERREYISTQLSKAQIYDYEYLLISDEDFEKLRKEPMSDIVYVDSKGTHTCALDQITEVQYYHILRFRKGNFKFEKLPYTFFKSRLGINRYKKYAETQDNERKVKIWALTYRVLVVVVFSTIFALAIINPTESNGKQVLFDTISRISNLFVSLFLGYSLAHDSANREIDLLEYKCEIIQQYDDELQSGIFVPKDREQIILEKIKKIREKKLTNVVEEKKEEPEELELVMSKEEYEKYLKEKSNERENQSITD